MPSGKFYHKQSGRWLSKETKQAFDYDDVDRETTAFLVSFFRWYPDYFLDLIEDENADFTLELPQRIMLRAFARFQRVDFTTSRGTTKTYCAAASCLIDGILFPGEVMRYYGSAQKNVAELASTAFHQLEKNYPALTSCWMIKSETKDTFKVVTSYGSELAVGVIQGANCHQITAEEIGQETEPKFNFSDYESKALATCRQVRTVNRRKDRVHIDNKQKIVTNASRRVNPAYFKYHNGIFKAMITEKVGKAFAVDMGWEMTVLCNLRSISYVNGLRSTMTADDFLRQMCATYTGDNDNPLVSDETLSKCRKLSVMEDAHCGDNEAIYIVSHDVSYEDGSRNAKCADVVLKLTKYKTQSKRDKYRKQVVYADNYAPPKTSYMQAQKVKALWQKYCKDGAETTYLVIDAQAYGKEVVEELMKPSHDGSPNLCCYKHMRYADIEQENALPVIYPLKAGTRGTQDEDGVMLQYAQVEFEHGNIELLTSAIADGMEQYKRRHGIKDDFADVRIQLPYRVTNELCEQIQNLVLKTSGTTLKETRRSHTLQRDIWSALKYALRMASILEAELVKANYKRKSSYSDAIAAIEQNGGFADDYGVAAGLSDRIPIAVDRARLIAMRRR